MLRGIHKLCEKGSWDEAIYDLRVDDTARKAASIPGGWGEWTPLHLACRRNAPLELIRELIKAAPIAAETFDLKDRLPIHYATEHGASLEILNALVQSCPESINGVDSTGHTPLHLSFLHSEAEKDYVRPFPTVDEVELLSDEEGTVAATADEAGNLPIHLAVNNIDQCSLDVLLTLICVDTKTLDKKNKDGLTPLHLALLNCAEKPISIDIVKALIGAAEDGQKQDDATDVLKIKDNNGRLPLHIACLNFEHVPLDVMRELLKGFEGAAAVPMSDGSLPLDILEGLRHTVTRAQDVLDFNEKSDFIFAFNPKIEQYRNEPSRLGRISNRIRTQLTTNGCLSDELKRLWTWMCLLSEDEDKDKMHFITISQTLNTVRDDSLKRFLASIETRDESGAVQPLSACVSDRVAVLLKRCLLFAGRYEFLSRQIEQTDSWCKIRALDWEDNDNQRTVVIKFMSNREEFCHETELRSKLINSAFPSVIPMIESFDLKRLGTDRETSGDAKYEYDISKGENPGGVDLSRYPCAMVLEECGLSLSEVVKDCSSKSRKTSTLQCAKDIADALRRLHSSGISHGGIDASSFVQMRAKGLVFESLRSAFVMEDAESSRKSYVGEAEKIRTGYLHPEMFVKLDKKDVEKYTRYWKMVADDAKIKNLLRTDDIRQAIAKKIDSFLVDANGSNFSDLWDRITKNAEIWAKIRPRRIGGSYYVIRTFKANSANGQLLHGENLPYTLCRANSRQDTWTLGLLFFEILTGEEMFQRNRVGDILDDTTFLTLCNWDIDGEFAQDKLALIHNPVARDLLRNLLGNAGCINDMEKIRQHAFFGNNEGESRRQCLNILKREKDTKVLKEQTLEKQERLRRRTRDLLFLNMETQQMLESATWALWNEPDAESNVPTTFALLPYKLQEDGKGSLKCETDDDKKIALRYGLAIATFLHYTRFSGAIAARYGKEISKDCCSTKLWEYSELNKKTLSVTESNLLAICRGILTRIKNAELVLKQILTIVLPDVDHELEAKKLVRDAVEGIVDVDTCRDVTEKAAVVEKAVKALLVVANDSKTEQIFTEQIVSEQLERLTGKDSSLEEDTKKKTDVEMTLFRLVKEFSENPLAASRDILMKKIEGILDFYASSPVGVHLYLVDDMTGVPVQSSVWPLKVSLSPTNLRVLIPGVYLSMKSFCTTDITLGLSSMLGLSSRDLPKDWITEFKWNVGGSDSNSTEFELNSLQAATGSKAGGMKHLQLKQLQAFILSKDPHENFSGLARILSQNNKVLWTIADDYQEEKQVNVKEIKNLGQSKKLDFKTQEKTRVLSSSIGISKGNESFQVKDMFKATEENEKGTMVAGNDSSNTSLGRSKVPFSSEEEGDSSEIPAQVTKKERKEPPVPVTKKERKEIDEQRVEKYEIPEDDMTVSTINSMVSNLAAANKSAVHEKKKIVKPITNAPSASVRKEQIMGKVTIHDDVTPRASSNNRTLHSVLKQRSSTPVRSLVSGNPLSRSHRAESPVRSYNSENIRSRANVRNSPFATGFSKKSMGLTDTTVGSPGIIDDSDDVSVISMSSTVSKRKNMGRFRSMR